MPVFHDFSGRSAGTRALRLRGAAVAVVIALVAVVVTAYSQGRFADRFTLRIDAATVGEGLAPGAEVKLNGFAIGTVRSIDAVGYGHQVLELELDRDHAAQLTDDVVARYTSSNVFGSTAVELVNSGGGLPLTENATLRIGENITNATVTSVFRQAGRLTRVLDTDAVNRLFDVLITQARALGPSVGSFFEAARMLADGRHAPVAEYLRIGADVLDGSNEVTPVAVDLIAELLDTSAYFGEEENRDRTDKAIYGLADRLLRPLTDILATNNADLNTIIGTVLDLVVPIAAAIGSLAPAYNRIPALLDHIGDAFPVVDGKVQLQLQLIDAQLPYLVDSILGGPR